MRKENNLVRTAQDLERKYDFSQLGILKKNYELQKESLTKVENELNDFANATTNALEELQDQVDGNISTWFYSGVPTTSNAPANSWITDEEKNNHLGDLYYDQETGYAYRFALDNSIYKWISIKDTDVTRALALANAAQDTADAKRRVFVSTPSPPYDVGDLWIRNQELYRCQTSKASSESYESNDWIVATKYTDDTVANQVGANLTILSGTVTEIREDVDELETTMTNTVELVDDQGDRIGTLETQTSQTSQTVNEISQTVSYIGKLEVDKETFDYIHITDAKQDQLLNLIITGKFGQLVTGDDLVVSEDLTMTDTYLIVDKTLELSQDAITYHLPDMNLKDEDKLIIVDGVVTIEREDGTTETLSDETVITLYEGENYVYLQSYRNKDTKLHLKYKVANDYTKEFATKVELNTSIIQTKNDIAATIEENYYDRSTVEQLLLDTKNGLTNKYSVGGGNNLLRNTGLYFETNTSNYSSGFEFWNGTVKRVTNMNSKSKTSMYLQNGTVSQRQEIPNDIYTISFQYNRLNNLAIASVNINDIEFELDESGTFSQTIEIQTSDIRIEFECDTVDGYEIYELMCNFGEVALQYTQNANETKTDTVEISEGIKITDNRTNSIFRANSDGIRIYDKNDETNITTEFTDKGTNTKMITANQGIIADMLIEKVGDQVWIVGI